MMSLQMYAKKIISLIKQKADVQSATAGTGNFEDENIKITANEADMSQDMLQACYYLLRNALDDICPRNRNSYQDKLDIFFWDNPNQICLKVCHNFTLRQKSIFNPLPSPLTKLPLAEWEKSLDQNLSTIFENDWQTDETNQNCLIKHFSTFLEKDAFLNKLRAVNDAFHELNKSIDLNLNFSYQTEDKDHAYWVSVNKERYDQAKLLIGKTTAENKQSIRPKNSTSAVNKQDLDRSSDDFQLLKKKLLDSAEVSKLQVYGSKHKLKKNQISAYVENLKNSPDLCVLLDAVKADPKVIGMRYSMRANTAFFGIYRLFHKGASSSDTFAQAIEAKLNNLISNTKVVSLKL